MKFPSLTALEVVKMTTSSAVSDINFIEMTTSNAASDENFFKMMTFLFQGF